MDREVKIGAAKTAFEIVELLSKAGPSTTSELATRLDMPVSTVHDYLQTLCAVRYVTRDGDEYRPSYRFLKIGEIERSRNPVHDIARPKMEELAEETGELVSLLVEEHGKGIHLAQTAGVDAIEFGSYSGVALFLHATAPGKAILAHLPEDRVDKIIDRHGLPAVTNHTITDREELETEFSTIRDQGYATDDSEIIEGLSCVAAPILNREDRPLAAISICPPTSRLDDEAYKTELCESVTQAAEMIQVRVRYS